MPEKVAECIGCIWRSREESLVTWYEHALSQYIFDLAGCSLACRDERFFAGAVEVVGASCVCVEVIGCGVDSNELLLISRRM